MIRLQYIPRDLIAELMKQKYYLVAPQVNTSFLLRNLIFQKLQSMDLIMEKCWQRLDDFDSAPIKENEVELRIQLALEYMKLIPNSEDRSTIIMQKYINKFTSLVSQKGFESVSANYNLVN